MPLIVDVFWITLSCLIGITVFLAAGSASPRSRYLVEVRSGDDTGSSVVVGFGISSGDSLSLAPDWLSAIVPERIRAGSFRIVLVIQLETISSSLTVMLSSSGAASIFSPKI